MADEHEDTRDRRPDVAKEDHGKPREDVKEKWHDATDTMNESPAGSPNATKQSRVT